jgi:hypothetical protein
MSNVSTAHDVIPFESGKTKPLSGQRLAKVIAKPGKRKADTDGLTQSMAVSIPLFSLDQITAAIPNLTVQIQELIEDAQDKIIREAVEEGKRVILDSEISIDAVVSFLNAVSKGNRLTKEIVQQWFVDSYAEHFMSFYCSVNKWDVESLSVDQANVLEQKSNAVRDIYASLASGKTRLSKPVCLSLTKFWNHITNGDTDDTKVDARMISFQNRIAKMLEEDTADALGF